MKIQVTAEDIANGSRGHCAYCPVALAVKRAFGHKDVAVRSTSIRVFETVFYTPVLARDFIEKFDLEGIVDPIEFELKRA